MRVLVEAGKIEEKETRIKARQLEIEDSELFGQDHASLLQILRLIKNTVGERLGVLRDPLSIEEAHVLPQFAGIASGSREGPGGLRRIYVDRGDVELKVRVNLLQVEFANSANALQRGNQHKFHLYPVAPLSFPKHNLASLDGNPGKRLVRPDCYGKVCGHLWFAFPKRVIWPKQLR